MANKFKDIPLTGRFITSLDSTQIGENFSILQNLRYTINGLEGIGGMSKINTTTITSHPKIRNGFHLIKDNPSESHILVQAWNSGLTASKIYDNTTAIPNAGDFSASALHTDDSNATIGRFSSSPGGEVVYCNGVETMIWGGNETFCSGFVNYDPSSSFEYDYTYEVSNTETDANNVASINGIGGGNDADTVLLLHLDNNVTDTSSGGTTHTVTNNNVTFSAVDKIFGTHSAVFNGSNAYLTIPDHADFDLNSDGIWTVDFRVKVDSLSSINPIYYQEHTMASIPFTSGSDEPDIGDTLSGAVSGETMILHHIDVTSGSWATNDAAGELWSCASDLSGAFNASEQIDNDTKTQANIAQTNGATVNPDGEDYSCMRINTDGSLQLCRYETYAGASVVPLQTVAGIISAGTWYHVAFVEAGNDWYIFVDGFLKAYVNSAVRMEDHDDIIYIGYSVAEATYLTGKLDEFRVSDNSRWISDFDIPSSAYNTNTDDAYLLIGSLRPLKGIKFYINTANTSSGTLSAYYWNSSGVWTEVGTLVDGTSSGGVSLAQTGSVTFSDTKLTAYPKYYNNKFLYWYKIDITNVDTGTEIYYTTLDGSFQDLVDIWDGELRSCLSFQLYDGAYNDYTINTFEEDYTSANTGSYVNIGGLTTSDYLVAGFTERATAISLVMVGDNVNTSEVLTRVDYWNGSAWIEVNGLVDGTITNGKSLTKSGVLNWNAPSKSSEFTQAISFDLPLYYYKISFSGTLSANVFIDAVTSIPDQTNIEKCSFSFAAQGRLWLCYKNIARCSARDTSVVFNGEDSTRIIFGDDSDLVAGTSLYSQFGSSLYDIIIFCKKYETWLVAGGSPLDWTKYRVDDKIGCVAPLTMTNVHTSSALIEGLNKHIAIWQSGDGLYAFDGKTFYPLHSDISDLFDKKNINGLNQDVIDKSVGFFDAHFQEYHWLCATGTSTTLNKEFVFSFIDLKWYEINRTSGKYLQCGFETKDITGNRYLYGAIDTGFVERLENGTTFDGSDMVFWFRLGDLTLIKSKFIETTLRDVKLIAKAKTSTTNKIEINHYTDGNNTAKKTNNDITAQNSGYSIIQPNIGCGSSKAIFHSIECKLTTNNETYGFEPYLISVSYKVQGQDNH